MRNRRIEDITTLITEAEPDSLAEIYHENSKLRPLNTKQYGEFVASVMSSPYLMERMAHSYKTYPTVSRISLPQDFCSSDCAAVTVERAIELRRTVRDFSGEPISIEQISRLLHYGYGITVTTGTGGAVEWTQSFRAAPSGGALYPLELYFVVWTPLDFEPGIYHYCVPNHALELVKPGDFSELATTNALSEDIKATASGVFLVSGIFRRSMLKYNERGYRFVLIEAGHLAQNMCLAACTMNLGIFPIGGFLDDELNRMVMIDGVNETVIYVLAVGGIRNALPLVRRQPHRSGLYQSNSRRNPC